MWERYLNREMGDDAVRMNQRCVNKWEEDKQTYVPLRLQLHQ